MPNQSYAEGTVIHNPTTGVEAIMRGGKWTLLNTPAAQARLPKIDQDALGAMTADMTQKQILASRAQDFMKQQNAGSGVATGPGYSDLHIPFISNMIPNLARTYQDVVYPDQASKLQTMDSIANQTFPMMRPAGQGLLLEVEAKAFKAAFPSVTNFGPANTNITARLVQEAKDAAAKNTFVQQFVRAGKGSAADCIAAYQPPQPAQQPGGKPSVGQIFGQ
jgi:hypothetical protein